VRNEVAAIGANWACVRLPRALSDWQDVYVISPSPIANARLRRIPKGFLDEPQMLEDGVHIRGWATSVDAPPDRVEVRLDDEVVATTRDFAVRPDVAAFLGQESAARSGWECIVPHASIRSFRYQVATISAYSTDGDERILFLGTLDSLLGTVARLRAQALVKQVMDGQHEIAALRERLAVTEHQRGTLEQQVAAMRQSKFWKARDRWFALKRAARLTTEE
jgi:hypothetical protein